MLKKISLVMLGLVLLFTPLLTFASDSTEVKTISDTMTGWDIFLVGGVFLAE